MLRRRDNRNSFGPPRGCTDSLLPATGSGVSAGTAHLESRELDALAMARDVETSTKRDFGQGGSGPPIVIVPDRSCRPEFGSHAEPPARRGRCRGVCGAQTACRPLPVGVRRVDSSEGWSR